MNGLGGQIVVDDDHGQHDWSGGEVTVISN